MWRISAHSITLMWQQAENTTSHHLSHFCRTLFFLVISPWICIFEISFFHFETLHFCVFYVILLPLEYINTEENLHTVSHLVFNIRICKAIILRMTWFSHKMHREMCMYVYKCMHESQKKKRNNNTHKTKRFQKEY